MYYFVPSWYHPERPWYDTTPFWFQVAKRISFDDTVNQLKMFHTEFKTAQLMLLNYQPQLRYALHKQDLLEVAYWSFFDDIQSIYAKETQAIYFKELAWPQGVTFVYTPFSVVAKIANQEIATIHFGESGNLHTILFKDDDGQASKSYVFDDRGFLSSLLYYQEGKPLYQDYLNPNGVWQVREYLSDDRTGIEINPIADKIFQKAYYNNWEELIIERLETFKESHVSPADKFVIAADVQHNELLLTVFPEHKKGLSFFSNRVDLSSLAEQEHSLKEASLIIVDKKETEEALKTYMSVIQKDTSAVLRITPFDTRLRLGHSQELRELELYYFIDTISDDVYHSSLALVLAQMQKYPLMTLRIVTFDSKRDKKTWLSEIEDLIERDFDKGAFYKSQEDGENRLESYLVLDRIQLYIMTSELDVIVALDRARLVLDLGEKPDLYTQIASISAGIPQINRVASDYVQHKENGWILTSLADLDEACAYYFDGLSNWNKALVKAVHKMSDYTSGQLLKEWHKYL